MRRWFSALKNKEDARVAIRGCAVVFFGLAAMQVAVAAWIYLATSEVRRYARIADGAVFDYLSVAFLIAVLAGFLRAFQSRVAAVFLLLVSGTILISSFASAATHGPRNGSVFVALVAVVVAVRAIYATVKFRRFISQKEMGRGSPEQPSPSQPTKAAAADFISHPRAGVEATAAPRSPIPKDYDRQKWDALLKYDDQIAAAANRVRRLRGRWEDELARAYLILNDKSYLRKIEDKIYAEERAEAARSKL
jgi:hypothetical protein